LKSIPLSITAEGSDEEMEHMINVITEAMVQMRKRGGEKER